MFKTTTDLTLRAVYHFIHLSLLYTNAPKDLTQLLLLLMQTLQVKILSVMQLSRVLLSLSFINLNCQGNGEAVYILVCPENSFHNLVMCNEQLPVSVAVCCVL